MRESAGERARKTASQLKNLICHISFEDGWAIVPEGTVTNSVQEVHRIWWSVQFKIGPGEDWMNLWKEQRGYSFMDLR